VTGVGYFLGCLQWLVTVTVVGWIALCLFLALYPAVWAMFVGALKPRQSPFEAKPVWMKSWHNLGIAALAAAAWVGLEWLRGTLLTGFGWNGLGIALHENIALIQIADITGVGGLSFLLVMANMMIVITIKRLQMELGRHRLRPHYDFSLTVALVALAFSYGVRELFQKPVPGQPLSIAAVQGNVPIQEKRDPEHEELILEQHIRLTEVAMAKKPDLIIWPEAATPRPLFSDQRTWDVVRGLAEKHDGDLLLGTVNYSDSGDFNSVVLLTEGGKTAQTYNKIHLVPFGEYLPLREWVPFPTWITSQIPDDFDFGRGPAVLEMIHKPVKIAPLICFEDTLGDLARRFVQLGAQLFVTVTNDGWFLKSAGSRQHLNHAIFRCVETKIPMVRAANTGVSCTIDPCGRILQRLQNENGDTFIEGILFAEINIPANPVPTFFTRNGELFSLVCLGIFLAAGGALIIRSRKSV
jgi:apolipoprotein N-acyltransferase